MNANPSRLIGTWLLFVAFLIYIMIGIGGYTRLSGSGLSMVKWKPATGWLPPLSELAWEEEFSNYKEKPQYKEVNTQMDLEGFKEIYYPEYLHRVFGRLIGLAYFLPFFIFVITKKLKGTKMWAYLFIGLLGGIQGGVGWFMVKSELIDDPQVSAYRLALHLCLAGLLLWLCFLRGYREVFNQFEPLKNSLKVFLAFIALQITTGAFVSGQQAGVAYRAAMTFNTDVYWVEEMGLKNITENLATILMVHITGGMLIFLFALIISVRHFITHSNKKPFVFFLISVVVQVGLGWQIAAHYIPRSLTFSLTHQLIAFIVLLCLTICAILSQNPPKVPLNKA